MKAIRLIVLVSFVFSFMGFLGQPTAAYAGDTVRVAQQYGLWCAVNTIVVSGHESYGDPLRIRCRCEKRLDSRAYRCGGIRLCPFHQRVEQGSTCQDVRRDDRL
ncbi:MAG: hypothetical protein JRI73_04440 [Deltaproteobacteria bacterium]|nr:hypothetical protein [Deltaproteobacteria bacterium]